MNCEGYSVTHGGGGNNSVVNNRDEFTKAEMTTNTTNSVGTGSVGTGEDTQNRNVSAHISSSANVETSSLSSSLSTPSIPSTKVRYNLPLSTHHNYEDDVHDYSSDTSKPEPNDDGSVKRGGEGGGEGSKDMNEDEGGSNIAHSEVDSSCAGSASFYEDEYSYDVNQGMQKHDGEGWRRIKDEGGWLWKANKADGIKSMSDLTSARWSRRYFTTLGTYLLYYSSPKRTSVLAALPLLETGEISRYRSDEDGKTFCIMCNGKGYFLRAQEGEEMMEWVRVLNSIKDKGRMEVVKKNGGKDGGSGSGSGRGGRKGKVGRKGWGLTGQGMKLSRVTLHNHHAPPPPSSPSSNRAGNNALLPTVGSYPRSESSATTTGSRARSHNFVIDRRELEEMKIRNKGKKSRGRTSGYHPSSSSSSTPSAPYDPSTQYARSTASAPTVVDDKKNNNSNTPSDGAPGTTAGGVPQSNVSPRQPSIGKEDGDWMKPQTRRHLRWANFKKGVRRTVGNVGRTITFNGCRKPASKQHVAYSTSLVNKGGTGTKHRKMMTDSNERQLASIVERHLREAKLASKEEEILYLDSKVRVSDDDHIVDDYDMWGGISGGQRGDPATMERRGTTRTRQRSGVQSLYDDV